MTKSVVVDLLSTHDPTVVLAERKHGACPILRLSGAKVKASQ